MTIEMLGARSIAAPVAAIALSAWLGVSNHCALGAAVPEKTPAAVGCCPFHSHPAKPRPPKQSDAQPCCKTLRAIPSAGVKSCAPAVVHLADVDLGFGQLIAFAQPTICFGLAASDTGPPGKTLFAELIGSIRPHAPPSLG